MPDRAQSRSISAAMAGIFAVLLAALLVLALFPIFPGQLDIRAGDVAARTLRSPRSVSFESQVLTNQRREERANAVRPSLVLDTSVRTTQVASYDETAAQIARIRTQAIDDLRKRDQLAALGLTPRSAGTVLTLPEERWQAVYGEGRGLLEDVLAGSLDDASLPATKDGIDSRIAEEFSADEALLTAELVRPLIVPTLREDTGRTEQEREEARLSVAPERIDVRKNDVIVDAGAEVDAVAIETLEATGLLESTVDWQNVAAVAIVASVVAIAIAGYLFVMQPGGVTSWRHLIALAVIVAMPLLVMKLYLPLILPDEERQFLAFIVPVAAAPVLIAALLDTDVAVVSALAMGVLTAFVSIFLPDVSLVASIGSIDTMRLLLVYALAPLAAIYVVHRAERLSRHLAAGLAAGGMAYVLLLATWFIDADRTTMDLGWMALASSVGGVSSGLLAAGAFVTVGALFGITTRVQLMELAQLNAPLLRRLQDEAPATFHHSIIVGNLAERAALMVGADALLTRVGCYYHDVGKMLQPGIYIENQLGGENPHNDMTPQESAHAIQQHVIAGIEMARRARLPARVRAFIPEHHGTRLVPFFYRQAAERDPSVDPALFQYPGPRPQSRETAIVMLADSTEAVVRASPDRSPERIAHLVEDVIAERIAEGQLDESDLTLRDLRTIAESFKQTMAAVYHPRVQYPEPSALETRRRLLRLPRLTPQEERERPGQLPRSRRSD